MNISKNADAHWEQQILQLSFTDRRLFGCECIERALNLYEAAYPNDNQLRDALEVARKYAEGKATKGELAAAYDRVVGICDTVTMETPSLYLTRKNLWSPAAVATACSIVMRVDDLKVNPVDISRLILGAFGDRVEQEKRWQYDRVSWYLARQTDEPTSTQ